MQVFVVSVALADITGQTVDSQIHLAQPDGLGHLLLTIDTQLSSWVLLMFSHKTGTLNEHTAGTTGRVENAAVERLNDSDDKLDDGRGSEELAALLTFTHCKVAKEVFVYLAEGVPLNIHGNRVHGFEQFLEQGVLKSVVCFW